MAAPTAALPPGVLSLHVLPADHHEKDWDAIIVPKDVKERLLAQALLTLKHGRKLSQLAGEKKGIAFGSQIRTYTFHPEQRIKDHRTGVEVGNVEAVMDGDLDEFIKAYLLAARGKA